MTTKAKIKDDFAYFRNTKKKKSSCLMCLFPHKNMSQNRINDMQSITYLRTFASFLIEEWEKQKLHRHF